MQNRVSPELRRNTEEKLVFGVASGLADYFGVDAALTRVFFVITAFLSAGLTLLAYLLLAIFVSEQEHVNRNPASAENRRNANSDPVGDSSTRKSSGSGSRNRFRTKTDVSLVEHRRKVGGWIIVGLGVVLLATNLGVFRWLSFGRFWPLLLVALGLAIIFGVFRGQREND